MLLRSFWSLPPSPPSWGIAGCAHQGQETFPLQELLHINSYKAIRCCLGVKIAFIKASHWNLRGHRCVCPFYIPHLIPGTLCDFGGLPALSTLWGGVSCVAAHTLQKLAALTWLLGSVSPCKPWSAGYSVWCAGCDEQTQFPLNGGKCDGIWSAGTRDSTSPVVPGGTWRYSLTRILIKSHTCLASLPQSRQPRVLLEKNKGV